MAKQPSGLGRGLDSLLSGSIEDGRDERLTTVAVGDIKPGRYQPRVQMDDEALQELAECRLRRVRQAARFLHRLLQWFQKEEVIGMDESCRTQKSIEMEWVR